jgi:hypothetical protein
VSDQQPLDRPEASARAFDVYKHITTLSAGSIVLIGTFLKDIFPYESGTLAISGQVKSGITLAFVLFGASLVMGTLFMTMYSLSFARARFTDLQELGWEWALVLPMITYALGIIAFGTAVVLNLYQ